MALTKEQLAARKVGGSDIATILGLNQYKTELELYFEKLGELPPADLSGVRHVRYGNMMEPVIADMAAEELTLRWQREVKLRRCNLTLTHPKYDWLTAHIDRDVVGLERGVECKNVGPFSARYWGKSDDPAGVPMLYAPQVHAYMLIKDYPVWTVAAYMGGDDLRLYEVERSKEWDDMIVTATHDFWHNHVLKGIPPDPALVAPERRMEVARRVYPGTTGEFIEAADLPTRILMPGKDEQGQPVTLVLPPDEAKLQYELALAEAATAEAHAEHLKGSLVLAMGNAAVLQFSDGTQLVRKLEKRKAYTVEAKEYMKSVFKKPRKGSPDDTAE